MKLLRAKFQNFRMLRDLELEFSHDPKMNLTVIRAANESGKTTILHGLQWALYGEIGLPRSGNDFRLQPIDWLTNEKDHVEVKATIEFELTESPKILGGEPKTISKYRLIRSTLEKFDDNFSRIRSEIKLFELSEVGTTPISEPEAFINAELPPELREVFFTDGDRALTFIEADVNQTTKRKRVQRAIHSLLGLDVIDAAINHIRKSEKEVNRKAKNIGDGSELKEVTSILEAIEDKREKLDLDFKDFDQQLSAHEKECVRIDHEIETALVIGDKEELKQDLQHVRGEIKRLDAQIESAESEHSNLFRSRSIAISLIEPVLADAYNKLDVLRDQGKIPNITIPLLRDRLDLKMCICGETLEPKKLEDKKRRTYIEKLIVENENAHEIDEFISQLYYNSKSLLAETVSWLKESSNVIERINDLQNLRSEKGRKSRKLEAKLDRLPDTDIKGLRIALRKSRELRDRFFRKKTAIEVQLKNLDKQKIDLEKKRNSLLRMENKGKHILAELNVIQDIDQILENAYGRIADEELKKVSNQMNNIFITMIGSDPEQGAIIQRAEISPEFDINVYGPEDRKLNPDQDLNGASRRALTLAFILALTKVSEVEAPNVIDTPLGMASGYVKRSILKTSIRESNQLILLLTHDEINGCEDVIDENAGCVYTLTNPAHYPIMLINDPKVSELKALRCDCNHKTNCNLCERRLNPEADKIFVS